MNRARGVFVVVGTLLALGCAGPIYELQPVPRAGDGTPPVKAQVRRVSWQGQSESGDLAGGALVSVEVDLYDADPSRPITVGPLRMEARPALGGSAVGLVPAEDPTDLLWGALTREQVAVAGAQPAPFALPPREARTVWVTFEIPEDNPPRGLQRLVVIVPVQDQPALELAVADPAPGGPRWPAGRVVGAYVFSGAGTFGSPRLSAFEPLGLALRLSREHWVLGVGASYTFLYQEALAGGPPGQGVSLRAQVTWQPWTWRFAPYAEVGSFTGYQDPPTAYSMAARTLELPRVGAGVLVTFGKRLGDTGALPFEHVLSPQREVGVRLGYTRWFNTGERGGSGGLELTVERGFGP